MIFIKGNFPSFKNSKQFTGKFFIMSKTVQKYLKAYEYQWVDIPPEFKRLTEKDFPIVVGFHFVRGTKHRFDFHNMIQGCADLLVKHGWIPDDSMDYFVPQAIYIQQQYYRYDKDRPGVWIKLLRTNHKKNA